MTSVTINDSNYELTLDWDAIYAYEMEHSDWDIVKELGKEGNKNRISEMNFLVSFIKVGDKPFEGGWIAFINDGFTPNNLLQVYRDELQKLGFISVADPSAE